MVDDRSRLGRGAWRLPTGIAVVVTVLAVASTRDPRWLRLLQFERLLVVDGQWWRLFTAHLVHLTLAHAVLDTTALLLVAWIFSREFGWRLQLVIGLAGMVAVDAGLWLAQIDRYAGLSGVLHACFAAGATHWSCASRSDRAAYGKRLWGSALIAGLCAKLFLELRGQSFWLDDAGFPVVTVAHRCGAAGGVACGLCVAMARRRFSPSAAVVGSRAR